MNALLAYLARRGMEMGPLFVFEDGWALSRQALVDHVKAALRASGIPADRYSGHSFRIGAATSAAAAGIEDSTIRTLGRWRSDAYTRYIRMDPRDLASFLRD